MAWWGPGFNPVFDIEDIQNDIDIISNAIPRLQARIPIDAQVDEDHKTIWNFWNPLCNNIDLHNEVATGNALYWGLVQEADVAAMASGQNSDVIYQSDPTVADPAEPYYFGMNPNTKYLFGTSGYQGVVPLPPFLKVAALTNEASQLAIEDSHSGAGPGDISELNARHAACNAQIDYIAEEVAKLDLIITDSGDGEATYPHLTTLKDACVSAKGRANVASAKAAARLLSSVAYTAAQIVEISTRLGEIGSDVTAIESAASDAREARYAWTDVRCSVSYGSLTSVNGNVKQLARLEADLLRLEKLLAAYETL